MPTEGDRALPRLTRATASLTQEIRVLDAAGEERTIRIPDERPLTVYVDRHELVTLMTLGQYPEWLVLGYLLNQRLLDDPRQVDSVTVDWSVDAAAVRTRNGRGGSKTLRTGAVRPVVNTGCAQGTMFAEQMDDLGTLRLPAVDVTRIDRSTLLAALERMREQPSIHREAGSVHGTALFHRSELLFFVEDVGRHNAVDTVAGWMAMHTVAGGDKLLLTTGRLTSEMVLKAARMGVPIVVSRNGITAMGHSLAERLGMTLVGRAAGRRFLCYTGASRFDPAPVTAAPTLSPRR
ncbi:formate dehydrogenase accessory sulfurtransferase FdhD [Accumulibacter sp.]|uniref:formate dehydrogenase accessory sulfurtransferase FdhD n=1 Tax=Accumulibacter sp. TaxID=2053492 RepID=UPI0025E999BC|nr:formate dehydrogenase accessory sulfurtransferase FdhD [Accumulibacter sp.]MCM8613196.1 formate dehydrogenase accessory sulfurtransferase FdhD [Accumulibacter sp.]MCM8636517.1 formate dehydrogenase accessory sulfurtransferase FdhD [Accumulibacter sp.]